MSMAPRWMAHLQDELKRPDPWRLDSNPYERARYAAMRALLARKRYRHGLEIGCAAGAFSQYLAAACTRLRVVDILPEAIERTRTRLGDPAHVDWAVADIAELPDWGERYDLVVAAEVLYYLEDAATLARVVAHISSLLRPGGSLLVSSARDAVSSSWGLPRGAETVMALLDRHLVERERREVRGEKANEHAVVSRYVKP